ncbi:MAG: hypothetical protein ACRD3K_11415 [Edaphobacter sp.]
MPLRLFTENACSILEREVSCEHNARPSHEKADEEAGLGDTGGVAMRTKKSAKLVKRIDEFLAG